MSPSDFLAWGMWAGRKAGPVAQGLDAAEMGRAFDRQSVGKRIAIVLAGPAFNLIFPIFVLFFWVLASHTQQAPAVLGKVFWTDALAALAQFQRELQVSPLHVEAMLQIALFNNPAALQKASRAGVRSARRITQEKSKGK